MSCRRSAPLDRRSRSTTDRPQCKRSRSPYHHHQSSHKHKRSKPTPSTILPFQASQLHRHHYDTHKQMFELYLDIQKQLVLEDLTQVEVRGRWKSFVGKWNRGELAEGWYDPATLQKAQASAASNSEYVQSRSQRGDSPSHGSHMKADESSDEDLVGPTLPGEVQVYKNSKRPGPAIPNSQELQLRRELDAEGSLAQRRDLRRYRQIDRKEQKARLDELVPRADAGSKDRMLEKKREKADSNRAFASAKREGGGVEEVPESDLLGDDDGGIEGFKKQKRVMERKKNDRELRREEILRGRKEEREEIVRAYRAKEKKTMSGLVALAKARFG